MFLGAFLLTISAAGIGAALVFYKPPTDSLWAAREQLVDLNNQAVKASARMLGYRPGYGEGADCHLDGPKETTLVCGANDDASHAGVGEDATDEFKRDDLCGRGFRRVVIAGADQNLDCTGISLYHKAINKYGVEVWTH